MQPSEKIAKFVYHFDGGLQDDSVLRRIKAAIIDYVAVTIAGGNEESAKIVQRLIPMMGGNPQATIWATGEKSSVLMAALTNGTAAHALDYDDSSSVMRTHPSSLMLPGLFALGEYGHKSGKDILTAYATSFEVAAKLGRALNPELVDQGWLPVGVLGLFLQTLACAKMMSLDPHQVQMAMGIAANWASGLRCNNGSMAKPLLAGTVGVNGILAALLAKSGMTGNPNALESQYGVFENFGRKDPLSLQEPIRALGEPLDIIQTGIIHKQFPSCTGTHMPIECALQIVRKNFFDLQKIERIEVLLSSLARPLLIYPRPKNEMEAKFSLEYCVARAILDGQMGVTQFTKDKVESPEGRSLMEKVKVIYDEVPDSQKNRDWTHFPVEMFIYLKNGHVLSSRVETLMGSIQNPMSPKELEEKFHQCCRERLSDHQAKNVMDELIKFEELEDVNKLAILFRK